MGKRVIFRSARGYRQGCSNHGEEVEKSGALISILGVDLDLAVDMDSFGARSWIAKVHWPK